LKPTVPGKALIPAIAIQRHRHTRPRQFAQEESGNRRCIPEWLIVVVHEPLEQIERLGLHEELGMLALNPFGCQERV
jgi:hypothetical protein